MELKPTVYAFFGEQGSGKSSVSDAISRLFSGTKLSFAQPIYDAVSSILRVDARTLPKETPLPELGGKTLRYALQTLGTEWGRDLIHENLWVNNLIDHAKECVANGQPVFIDDLRFQNEYEALLDNFPDCKFIRVVRDASDCTLSKKHASENDWVSFSEFLMVKNDTTVGDAAREVLQALVDDQS